MIVGVFWTRHGRIESPDVIRISIDVKGKINNIIILVAPKDAYLTIVRNDSRDIIDRQVAGTGDRQDKRREPASIAGSRMTYVNFPRVVIGIICIGEPQLALRVLIHDY